MIITLKLNEVINLNINGIPRINLMHKAKRDFIGFSFRFKRSCRHQMYAITTIHTALYGSMKNKTSWQLDNCKVIEPVTRFIEMVMDGKMTWPQ
jgi:hypothetical protein